jgi:hypothetical protein
MVYDGIDLSNELGIQRFFHLVIPTKYQYLIGVTILIPVGVGYGYQF